MNGDVFRSIWIQHLNRWISAHIDLITLDEYVLVEHILELIQINRIQKSIFHHKKLHEGTRFLEISIKYLYEDNNWYEIRTKIELKEIDNACKYDPKEGF